MSGLRLFSSESVTEGHPDKICDQISDAILDDLLRQDVRAHVAVETMVTTGLVHVAGEVTTSGYSPIAQIVRDTITRIGYTSSEVWFDAVIVRQTVKTSGISGIALTKLDVLDGLEEIKVCVGYELDGSRIDYLPASMGAQAAVKPIYETLEGWSETTAGARSWAELPAKAVKYVRYIEELIGAPVALLSTSPERLDTILVHDPFQD